MIHAGFIRFLPWFLQDWYNCLERFTCFLRQYGNSLIIGSNWWLQICLFVLFFSLYLLLWYMGGMEWNTFCQLNIMGFNIPWKYKLSKKGFLKTQVWPMWRTTSRTIDRWSRQWLCHGKTRTNPQVTTNGQRYLRKMRQRERSRMRIACKNRLYWSFSQNEEDRLHEGRQEPANCFWHFCGWKRTEMSKEGACCMI